MTRAALPYELLRYAAFTSDPKHGNPAGVVISTGWLSESDMQQIAHEVGYSETAFLVPRHGGAWDVRYYTPVAEVSFCGHATVASAVALADRGTPPTVFHTPSGPVPVQLREGSGLAFAGMQTPPAAAQPMSAATRDDLLAALAYTPEDLDHAWPPAVATVGQNRHAVLALGSRESLRRLDPHQAALADLSGAQGWTTVCLLYSEKADLLHVRNLAPHLGIPEDPATGSAAAGVAAVLLGQAPHAKPLPATQLDLRLVQGEDMGRRSDLFVAHAEGTTTVWGTAAPIRAG